QWQFWIDRGGTFTDVVAVKPDGALLTLKLLSDDPRRYEDAAVEGVRRLMGVTADQALSASDIEQIRMGTTLATNALLERKGEPTVLIVTQGFRDALRIGYQNRPRLFELHIHRPAELYARVIEVPERVDARGAILTALDLKAAEQSLRQAWQDGFRALAITLMHAYRYHAHELQLERLARAVGFTQISLSHKVSPLMRFVSRGDTTTVDAYLSPILRRYVDQLASRLTGVELQFMQSHGGLTRADSFQGKDAILSGPAGGIIGMVRTAQSAGFSRIIGFDMGGTSTDVSHFSGDFERQLETQIAGVRLTTPMLSIHTVAAGGGSILHFEEGRLRVGPDSAGADPGPRAYRRGGPLTVTDCNVLLGKIQPAHFPQLFGKEGDEPIDTAGVREAFTALAAQISAAIGRTRTPEQVAQGFIEIAVRNMANAIRRVSVERGYDVSDYVLNTFGGAGGQHACLVADQLGMNRVFLHPLAGVLSAYGMGLADTSTMRERTAELELTDAALPVLESLLQQAEREARDELNGQGIAAARIRVLRKVHLRYQGTDTAVPVTFAGRESMQREFETLYQQRFSFLLPERAIIAGVLTLEAIGVSERPTQAPLRAARHRDILAPLETVPVLYAAGWLQTPLYRREGLRAADCIAGPAIIVEAHSTTVVEPGWQAQITPLDHLILSRVVARERGLSATTRVDPMMLEVFANLFMAIAEQMGLRLQQSAHSVNIKERLDFSCAVFDRDGNLLANAPHMPVHLGSMSESIKTVIRENAGRILPGDSFAINDPYRGGTHLPDITVITPVFASDQRSVLFYVGTRGHHADIGGITPGSMPSDSRHLDQEGVLFTNWKLVSAGRLLEAQTRALLSSGPYPARNPTQNLADLRAQLAANAKGAQELLAMIEEFGSEVVQAYAGHVQDNAEEAVRSVIGTLKNGSFRLETDAGSCIQVTVRVNAQARSAVIDFTGSSEQVADNFNAPASITVAAVLYVFRSLVNRDIPLNAGCLRPLQIVIPEGSILNPRYPAAVVAGNVETSQCVTNALLAALGVCAASQCTMNNFSFGNDEHQYYETIAGGSGAGNGYAGTDAVQTHMTNSRLTDPEVLESRFPVLLESFCIREGSGGAGRWRGGNGVARRLRFLAPMSASILSNNRRVAPFGIRGGSAGACGSNSVQRRGGATERLSSCATVQMAAGEAFLIETPGGGGYGAA
ncbi:MAG TPA: hydantoinase B/oxoprolinase family protein, partial [Steroidobacteraceae bacterium]|nr:hydantoinase B/oxoprolinase family protein [Steroidobacteraceae bacterium]